MLGLGGDDESPGTAGENDDAAAAGSKRGADGDAQLLAEKAAKLESDE